MTESTSDHPSTPAALSPKRATVFIDATVAAKDPWYDYTMEAHFPDKGGSQRGNTELIFDKDMGEFDIDFILRTVPAGLKFRSSFDEAFWIASGSVCPAIPNTHVDGFSGKVKDDQTLFLNNKNKKPGGEYKFALRFDGPYRDVQHPPFTWDPIIRNGGGPSFGSKAKIALSLLVVGIGAALFVALR